MFDKHQCKNCSRLYDDHLKKCPSCKDENESFINLKNAQQMLWTNPFIELGAILLNIGGSYLFSYILAVLIPTSVGVDYRRMLINVLTYTILLVGMLALYFPKIKEIALSFKKIPILAAVVSAILMIVFSIIWGLIVNLIMPDAGVNQNEQAVREMVKAYPVPSFFMVVVFAPIVEELGFRAGLFSVTHRINRILAYVLTAIVFGLIHTSFTSSNIAREMLNLPSYLVSGILLCVTYEKFGIGSAITAHALNNLVSWSMTMASPITTI